MDSLKKQTSVTRIKKGAAILTAAQVVDSKAVKARLNAFAAAHTAYADAQRKLDEADALLRAEQARLAAVEPAALDSLKRALITDGQAIGNPFAVFGAPSSSAIKTLPLPEKAQVLRDLAKAVQRRTTVSAAVLSAAQAIEQLANELDPATGALGSLRDEVVKARQVRDVLAQNWDTTLAALRRGARAAVDEGAPNLYAALFAPSRRSTKKVKAPVVETPAAAAEQEVAGTV